MKSSTPAHVAIIGAGLGGLGLALGLHAKSIPCTIYEQATEPSCLGAGVMLSPNALSILDMYGVYHRLRKQAWNFEYVESKTYSGETTGLYFMGGQSLFGYKAIRIYRSVLIQELRNAVQERGIPILWGKKYSHVVAETDDEVTFEFSDGCQERAPLLVGSDGIHSKVRSYFAPDAEPVYDGMVMVVGEVKTAKLVLPANDTVANPIIFAGRNGFFILAAQDADGSRLMAGTQRKWPAQDRDSWARFAADHRGLEDFLRIGFQDWPGLVKSAIQGVDPNTFCIWPLHTLPPMKRWMSTKMRVVVLGDAAHAIPPAGGQGANQAFEDGFCLSVLLSKLSPNLPLSTALQYWQSIRQQRIGQVSELTKTLNNMRLPTEEMNKLSEDELWQFEGKDKGSGHQMEWLFLPKLEEKILRWVEDQTSARNGV